MRSENLTAIATTTMMKKKDRATAPNDFSIEMKKMNCETVHMCVCFIHRIKKKDLNCRTHGELYQQKERKNKNGRVMHVVSWSTFSMFNSTCDRQTAQLTTVCVPFTYIYIYISF